jgi:peptidylprolyl isomerase
VTIHYKRLRGFARDMVLAVVILVVPALVVASAQQSVRPPGPPRTQAPGPPPAAQPTNAPQLSGASDSSGSDVIARVGATNVTVDEVRAYVAQLGEREQSALARDPRLLGQTVRLMLANQLVLKEALAKKWEQQPPVAAQLERARQEAIIDTYLRSVSVPPAGFPSDADIENVYESNKSAFLVPRQYHLAQIVIVLAQGADKDTEEKAHRKLDEVQKKLNAHDGDFASIARTESDERESASVGGDLGWLQENQIRPEIRSRANGLAANALSEPVRLEDGWHILKLLDTKPASTRPLTEVRDQLAQRLREERAAANRRAYLAKLIEQSAINELALSKVLEGTGQKAR